MNKKENITYPAVQNILDDGSLKKEDKIVLLKQLLADERAAQRAATESNMVEDDGLNARLRHVTLALEALDVDLSEEEDDAATL